MRGFIRAMWSLVFAFPEYFVGVKFADVLEIGIARAVLGITAPNRQKMGGRSREEEAKVGKA
jgi:hypothetical protein